ncbi:hypothetical protein ABH930_006913 [Kitasatospora sp. GAS204A]|nr:hypothetical protein [Kitasatospora sp. GAS204B]
MRSVTARPVGRPRNPELDRAILAAAEQQRSEDRALEATAAYVRTEVFFASGILPVGLRALQGAVDAAPAATEPLQAAIGALHMRAAVVAGRMRDASVAHMHLAEAAGLTASLRETPYEGAAIGPDSRRIHQLSS